MPVHQHLAPELGQVPGHRDDIPDLAPVEVLPGELVDVHKQIVHINALVVTALEHAEQVAPDLDALVLLEVVVPQGEVDAALEGLVEGADSVGREDEDAVVVLEETEEHCGVGFSEGVGGSTAWMPWSATHLRRWRSAFGLLGFVPRERRLPRRGGPLHMCQVVLAKCPGAERYLTASPGLADGENRLKVLAT